jgi:glycine cleavage system aminomethyltransferase T
MGYVARDAASAGTQVMIRSDASGEDYAGVVHTKAFYDPEMARAKA